MDQIFSTLIKYLLGIIGIGTIVILHEFGHFIAARINKIDVEIFSLGFGPKLLAKTVGPTEYRISLILFGGYCKLKGSDDLKRALDQKQKSFKHIEEGSIFSVHPIKRVLTYLAGPLTNVLITIILCTTLLALNHQTLSTPARVATVNDYPQLFNKAFSPSYNSGIRSNDLIIQIDNQTIQDYQELQTFLSSNKKQNLLFKVKRNKKILLFNVSGEEKEDGTFRFGLTNQFEPIVAFVRLFSPERKAGLKKGDKIISVNGIKIYNNLDLLTIFSKNESNSFRLTVERPNEIVNIKYRPVLNNNKIKNNFSLFSPTKNIEGLNIYKALKEGFFMTTRLFTDTINNLIMVIKGQSDDVRQVLTGPMRASLMIGDITIMGLENNITSGLRALCYLLAIVSISIAIANLLPLPAFDGGQILIAIIETITTKKISPKKYWICQIIGIIGLILIFLLMYFVDLRYFYHLHFG